MNKNIIGELQWLENRKIPLPIELEEGGERSTN